MVPDLVNMILLSAGFGLGSAVGQSSRFYELLGRAVAASGTYTPKRGRDGKMLPTIEVTALIDVNEFQNLSKNN